MFNNFSIMQFNELLLSNRLISKHILWSALELDDDYDDDNDDDDDDGDVDGEPKTLDQTQQNKKILGYPCLCRVNSSEPIG